MTRQKPLVVWVVMAVLVGLLVMKGAPGSAQGTGADSASAAVQVVNLPNDRLGFFEPSTKRLYVYGADLRSAVMVVEIGRLGQPLRLVQRTAQ